ncbi:protein RGF1 INDUCIBLE TRANSCRIPTION FACTOR 1 isoform X2 [Manihot esculenta]|nr:protein RGF1 INDUCIBLE TRANSCRIPTION FACTOR 1 isoform X2 [Manihot esculenta]XP_043808692.1 protein RGF1 INDUCIBLE TRANSCRIPTION FACTOR 1 isoform X2 [Manihot esculenta]KAG8634793.1 hypothetical protein MANES_17G085975v8 [Manihot esculenta]KAG8634794.1 hypothetical protein MANES_17G085975v8 [Manihot esculenta]KAG8634795.1 hypothetical protein MANES_17G085975v8 [Manihot esculenta]
MKSDWLSRLLQSKFFTSCDDHQGLRKNEKNVFCIDCNREFCRHCVKSHCLHRQLQICKYVYHNVVRLQDIQKYLDCSRIQTYKINGEKAVHLNPRPQSRDAKPSTKARFGGSCESCGRYIQDLPNRFCCIACKFSAVLVKPKALTFTIQEFSDLSWKQNYNEETQSNDEKSSSSSSSSPSSSSSFSLTEISEETQGWLSSTLKPRRQLHKRKGIPRRAPFC